MSATSFRATRTQRPGAAQRVSKAISYTLLVVLGLAMLVPLLWMFISAIKPEAEIYKWPMQFIPSRIAWENFTNAWNAVPFGRFFVNSILVTVFGAGGAVALATTSAYGFVFLRFPLRNVLFMIMLGALMVPGHVNLVSNYLTASSLGWINTYEGIIVPGLATVFGTFLLRQHFLTIPMEVIEAARIDGTGHLKMLYRIVLPMSVPTVVTVALIAAINEWSGFVWPLIVTNSLEMRTLPIGLLFLRQTEGNDSWGMIMAATAMVSLPVLILFLIGQRFIVAGLTQGAVKG